MAVDSTSKALSLIFNGSLLHGEIPGDWKRESIKSNYRPFSFNIYSS